MKFKDFFVIGTDTDVGKTYVSTLLYKALKKHNFQYYKPIQSGCFLKDGKFIKKGSPYEVINEQNIKDVYNLDCKVLYNEDNKPYIIPKT